MKALIVSALICGCGCSTVPLATTRPTIQTVFVGSKTELDPAELYLRGLLDQKFKCITTKDWATVKQKQMERQEAEDRAKSLEM